MLGSESYILTRVSVHPAFCRRGWDPYRILSFVRLLESPVFELTTHKISGESKTEVPWIKLRLGGKLNIRKIRKWQEAGDAERY